MPSESEATPHKRELVQSTLVPGREAGEYCEPDASAGEEWPGRQAPTRQLSLFDTLRFVVAPSAVSPSSDDPDTQPIRKSVHETMCRRMRARVK